MRYPLRLPVLCCAAVALLGRPAAAATPGEQLYQKQCANCHGAAGEGTKKYREKLIGDLSVAQLAKVIAKTMPENKPGSLSDQEAEQVAAYIHEAFYSVAARERNQPPRIELARLTVRQYRSAVADLLGSFRPTPKLDDRRGLKGEYYRGRGLRDRVLERVDGEVAFNFGTDAAVADKTEPHEFSMRWTGSVLAPETGDYEFVVRTEHAARLWVNDQKAALIDAWVKSGKDMEYRGSIFLVGGRAYPLRLEYTKAKQGVDDSKTNKNKPVSAPSSIALLWKRPHRADAVVPSRNLLPVGLPESFVVAAKFPPDDRSYGWERGTSVSREWDEATTEAALETAGYVGRRINELAGTRDGAPDRQVRIRDFAVRFVERAFRRPLTDEQKQLYVDRQFEAAPDSELAVKRVVLVTLKSPRFLYREVNANPDGYDVASRLSFGLWDSLPDAELLSAAAAGQLSTKEQVARHAERMLADPRGREKLQDFLLTWLKVSDHPDVAKDPKRFPGFDAAAISDLRSSLELMLDDVVWSPRSDFRQLLLGDHIPLNGLLAKIYEVELPPDADFRPMELDSRQRAGVLTHPYMMATFAYTGESSPIHRGVFLARGVLGLALRPPPEAFTPLPAELHPDLSTRERVTLQTKPGNCMSCHGVINPLGFPLEHFDAIGRFRTRDNAKPIDATGSYLTRTGERVSLTGARALAEFLAQSEEVQESFAEQMFHHLVQQPMKAYGPDTRSQLRRSFAAGDFHIRKLAVETLAVSALAPRREPAELMPSPKLIEPLEDR